MRVRSTILRSLLILGLLLSSAAFAEPAPAAGAAGNTAAAADPLLQLLVTKGVLNAEDAKSLVGTPAEQRAKLLELLKEKGILSASDYEALAAPQAASFEGSAPHLQNAVMQSFEPIHQEFDGNPGTCTWTRCNSSSDPDTGFAD